MKAWQWKQTSDRLRARVLETHELFDGQGRHRASVWMNSGKEFTWHTYDAHGIGGENASSTSLNDAKRDCLAAIVVQGWAPGGWTVQW